MLAFFLALALAPSLAAERTLPAHNGVLRCLGAEEKAFHRAKKLGAVYNLNQALIGELIMVEGLDARPGLMPAVCPGKESPSVRLLEALLLEPQTWYRLGPTDTPVKQNINAELVKELAAGAPEMLLNFLSQVQGEAATPDCLEKHVPGLKTLQQEVRWLQDEVDIAKLAGKRARLRSIFKGVAGMQDVLAACREEASQRREKSKKTESGAGNPSAQ